MDKKTEALKLALKKAFDLGKRYWQQADSEYTSQWKKADVTLASFNQLIENTIREALADSALDRMAENARELGLDYEPPCKTGSQCTSKCQQCEQSAQQQEPVVWMYVNRSTHETVFQKHMRSFVDHSQWKEAPLYGEPLANHELQCVCGAVWCGDEMVHLPDKRPPASKPLTDEQRQYVVEMWRGGNWTAGDIIDAVEAAHGIKGEA